MLRNLFCLLLTIVCSMSANAEAYKYCMYDVEIGVGRTGTMRVNEKTNVEFNLPRHGIVRDLPAQSYVRRLLPDGHGGVVERLMCYDTDYSDIYVSDKFNISEHDHMLSLRIGDKDRLITGEKKYELSYVHHLKDDRTPCGDIFYYSLLGAYHEAETDTFRFCIRFDEPVPQSSLDSLRLFYGKLGSDRVHNEALTVVTDSMICGEITGLNPHEAVTVFMPLPEGYFNSSDVGMGIAWWMILFVTTILMCIAVIVREMRQHNRFIKVVECWPPKGRSSADLGYIYDTTVDSQDIISLIPYFAHRGLLDIDTTTGHPILHKKKEISDESPLYQRLLFDAMFAKSDTFDTKKPTKYFAKTWLKLEAEIKNANKGMADKYSPIKDTNGKDFSPKFFETEGKMGRFQKAIHWITSYLEMALTILLIVGILASFIHVPELLGNILSENYSFLLNLVNYVATIIIAIELIHVLNSQNLESVIEILMLAFTRELVIREWQMWQLLIGVGCIAGLFAIKKWLFNKEE